MDIKYTKTDNSQFYIFLTAVMFVLILLGIGQFSATQARKSADAQLQLDRTNADNALRTQIQTNTSHIIQLEDLLVTKGILTTSEIK